jgi:hypothetical protein
MRSALSVFLVARMASAFAHASRRNSVAIGALGPNGEASRRSAAHNHSHRHSWPLAHHGERQRLRRPHHPSTAS